MDNDTKNVEGEPGRYVNEPTGKPYPDDCPFGGDTADDCAGCAYSGDYHFDPESGQCIARED